MSCAPLLTAVLLLASCASGPPGAAGLACWDLDGDGAASAAEDVNGDGTVDVGDCASSGVGLACWDLNENGVADAAEDTNGDGTVDVDDCRTSGGTTDPDDTGAPAETMPTVGDMTLVTEEAAAALCDAQTVVYGNLGLVLGWGLDDFSPLACLEEVHGDITIEVEGIYGNFPYDPAALELPELGLLNLAWVAGELSYVSGYNNPLRLSLPELRHIGAVRLETGRCYPDAGLCASRFSAPNLETVEGKLWLKYLGEVELHALDSVRGGLFLSNTGLRTIDRVPSLRQADFLTLTNNEVLSDVTGLHSIEQVTSSIIIRGNYQLPTSAAEALVEAIGRENIGGEITITGNAE